MQASDVPQSSELLYQSKLRLSINRLLFKDWPNEEVQRKNYRAALEGVDPETMESLSVVDTNSGDVIGHLTMARKRPAAKSENKAEDNASAVGELNQETKDFDHLDLTFIVAHPSHRNQGIGKALMEILLNKAKERNLPLVVGSEPQVYDYFVKLGFKETKQVVMPLADFAPRFSGYGDFALTNMVWRA